MKKNIIIVILMVVLILVIIKVALNGQRDTMLETKSENNQEVERQEGIIEMTDETFEEEVLNSNKPVVVDFYATWCNPCQDLFPIIEEIAKEREAVKFVKIDIEKERDTATQYQIKAIPTLVLFEEGKEKGRIVEAVNKNQILEFIEGR